MACAAVIAAIVGATAAAGSVATTAYSLSQGGPKMPAAPPGAPRVDTAAKTADSQDLLRRRRGYAATSITGGVAPAPAVGAHTLLGQ